MKVNLRTYHYYRWMDSNRNCVERGGRKLGSLYHIQANIAFLVVGTVHQSSLSAGIS